jgi:hypothetical protein
MTKIEYFKKLRADQKSAELAEQARLVPNPRYKTRYSFSEISQGLDRFPRLVTPEQLEELNRLKQA